MLFLTIKLIVFTLGTVAFLKGGFDKNAIMMSRGLYLLIALNFFKILQEENKRRDLEDKLEVYHNAYMKLVKKKK